MIVNKLVTATYDILAWQQSIFLVNWLNKHCE